MACPSLPSHTLPQPGCYGYRDARQFDQQHAISYSIDAPLHPDDPRLRLLSAISDLCVSSKVNWRSECAIGIERDAVHTRARVGRVGEGVRCTHL